MIPDSAPAGLRMRGCGSGRGGVPQSRRVLPLMHCVDREGSATPVPHRAASWVHRSAPPMRRLTIRVICAIKTLSPRARSAALLQRCTNYIIKYIIPK